MIRSAGWRLSQLFFDRCRRFGDDRHRCGASVGPLSSMAASRIAVPDVVRPWTIPEAEWDVLRFVFPFTVNETNVDSL